MDQKSSIARSFYAVMSKKDARQAAKAAWKEFQGGPRRDDLVTNLIRILDSLPTTDRLIAFLPLADEPDIRRALESRKVDVYVPCVEGEGQMVFRLHYRNGKELGPAVAGFSGIVGPPQSAPPLDRPLTEKDVALVPTLAVNPAGARLGRGGGYYDRVRGQLALPLKIGIVPKFLLNVPFVADSHDLILDRVVTEGGIKEYW